MGSLEKKSKAGTKRKNIQDIILSTIAVAGVVGVGLLAPNVLGAMGKLGLIPGKRQKEVIARSRDRLVARGLLVYEGRVLRITSAGEKMLRRLKLEEDLVRRKSKKWDKKWRMVIFDIPERRKGLRDKVRNTFVAFGFLRIQDSVWLYPYDSEDLVVLLKADFKIGKDLLYMIVESLEYDAPYRRHFSLPLT